MTNQFSDKARGYLDAYLADKGIAQEDVQIAVEEGDLSGIKINAWVARHPDGTFIYQSVFPHVEA